MTLLCLGTVGTVNLSPVLTEPLKHDYVEALGKKKSMTSFRKHKDFQGDHVGYRRHGAFGTTLCNKGSSIVFRWLCKVRQRPQEGCKILWLAHRAPGFIWLATIRKGGSPMKQSLEVELVQSVE
jgi:hypothetical protein